MSSEKKYPIAELFTSPQGEGLYAGTMMTFIRFAGCSVGKKFPKEETAARGLPIYTEQCTTWDGRHFECDTDFRTKEVLTVDEILGRIPEGVDRVCITGGEPLNHPLSDLLDGLYDIGLDVHIETSGTVPIQNGYPKFSVVDLIGESVHGWLWLTVCPKLGCLDAMVDLASEVKFLVDENFDVAKIPEAWKQKSLFYIQPINAEFDVNEDNLKRCLELQKQHPHWRISMQLHKVLRVR